MKTFTTWRHRNVQYLAAFRGDGWHVVDEHGNNFGSWGTVAEFRWRQTTGKKSWEKVGAFAYPSIRVSESNPFPPEEGE